MVKLVVAVVLGFFLAGLGGNAFAASQDEAKAMVNKAVAYIKENGKEKAFAEISNPKGKFVKGDIYVFVFNYEGVIQAHGGNQKLIGKSMIDLKDPDGKYFVKEFLMAGKKGSGWTDYKFTNPVSKKIEAKTTYSVGAGDLIVSSGVYK